MSETFQTLYAKMMDAKDAGLHDMADNFRVQIEEKRRRKAKLPSEIEIKQASSGLPNFALAVLGKSQSDLNLDLRSNCINAAFNFHDSEPHFETYSTLEFLDRIQRDFTQLRNSESLQYGDLIVMWSRNGGAWDFRPIDVHDVNTQDPAFPYGLIFDHVAVALNNGLVFHKPDPTLESRYQIDFLESVLVTTSLNRGFEVTYHRKNPSSRPHGAKA